MESLFALLAATLIALSPQSDRPDAVAGSIPAATDGSPGDVAADDLVFSDLEQRMTVPVEIAGAGPFRFVIDTGAQRSVISTQLARRLNLVSGRRVRVIDMAGTSDIGTVIVPSLAVSTLGGTALEAPAIDAQHLGAAGMLGIDSLQGHALSIDFEKQRMTVSTVRRRPVREGTYGTDIVIKAASLFGQLVVTNATVGGRRVRVVLDTGTTTTIGNLALRRMLSKHATSDPSVAFTSVLGGTLTAQQHVISDLKLGDAQISGLVMAFADAAPFRAFGLEDRPALLLGMDALRLFRRVDIDFANKELRLKMPRNAASL